MNPTNDPRDEELHGMLRALRGEGERNAPTFSQTWRAAKARQQAVAPSWRLAWAAAVAAAVALVAFILLPRQPKPSPAATAHLAPTPVAVLPGATDEALPTDFLLTTNTDDSVDRVAGEIDALLRP